MGLPQVIINLQHQANTAIQRSARGIVVLILDNTIQGANDKMIVYNKFADVITDNKFTQTNKNLIELAFMGHPSKVICYKVGEGQTLDNILESLKTVRFSYVAYPTDSGTGANKIATWVKAQRDAKHWVRAVLYNNSANSEGVVNFTTDSIVSTKGTFTGKQYTSRIAGILAGISLERSATYYTVEDATNCTPSATPDADVEAGKFFLINDGKKVKTSRAVNSLTGGENEEMKKIKIVEAIDLIYDDIRTTFEDSYVGKVANTYDNRVALCSAINNYFATLEREGVLYDGYDNEVSVDVDAQQKYLEENGKDTSVMTDEQIKNANTGSKVYIKGNVQFQDAMEDLELTLVI